MPFFFLRTNKINILFQFFKLKKMQKSSNRSTSSSMGVCTFTSSLKIQYLTYNRMSTFYLQTHRSPYKSTAQPAFPSRMSGWFDTTMLLNRQMLQTLVSSCESQSLQKQLLYYAIGTPSGNFLVMKEINSHTHPLLLCLICLLFDRFFFFQFFISIQLFSIQCTIKFRGRVQSFISCM